MGGPGTSEALQSLKGKSLTLHQPEAQGVPAACSSQGRPLWDLSPEGDPPRVTAPPGDNL